MKLEEVSGNFNLNTHSYTIIWKNVMQRQTKSKSRFPAKWSQFHFFLPFLFTNICWDNSSDKLDMASALKESSLFRRDTRKRVIRVHIVMQSYRPVQSVNAAPFRMVTEYFEKA